MDMRISGAGQIPSGEYENIRISGSAALHGFVRCNSCHVSGATQGEDLECKNECKISGSARFSNAVRAASLSVSGSFTCEEGLEVVETLSCSGSLKCNGSIRAAELSASGVLKCRGDIEAEKAHITGKLECGGLLNAEEINIEYRNGIQIESIGGSKIAVYRSRENRTVCRLPLLSKLIGENLSSAHIGSVEGDTIALEGVTANTVCGRIVAIGEKCNIDVVQYSEQLEISPKATVGRIEKI